MLTFRDESGLTHPTSTYMVRAVKLERPPSGTYFNGSQGVLAAAPRNDRAALPSR